MSNKHTRTVTSKSLFNLANNFNIQSIEDKLVDKGVVKQVFFDTAEIIDMIVGIRSFYASSHVNINLFNRESTLVHSLAYEGWLGEIHMLPPHQDELYHKITEKDNLNFPKKRYNDDQDIVNDLLYQAGITEIEQVLRKLSSEKEVKKYIIENFDKIDAPLLFKVAKLVQHPFWYNRYKYLLEEKKIIKINNSSYDTQSLIKKPVFGKIFECLSNARSTRSENNLYDAFSLTILQDRLERYKKDKENHPLPTYYVSSPVVYRALKNYIRENQSGHFYYKFDGEKIPIIRDSEFFILDAVFNATKEKKDDFENFMGEYHDNTLNLKDEISNIDKEAKLLDKVLNVNYNKTFRDRTNEIINLRFFKKIWLENKGLDVVASDLFRYYNETINDEKSKKELANAVEKEKNKIQKQFGKTLPRMKLSKKILRETAGFKSSIERINEYIEIPQDVFREFALTRFSFKENVCDKIQKLIERLFRSHRNDDNLSYVQGIFGVVNYLLDGVEVAQNPKGNDTKRYDEFTVGLAILWIFEEYSLINDICKRVSGLDEKGKLTYPDHRIALVHGSSIFPSGERRRSIAYEIIECLEEKFSKDNYKVWIGLSYIHFNIWNYLSNYPSLPELMLEGDRKKYRNEDIYKKYYKKAIFNLKKSIDYLKHLITLEINENEDRAYRRTKYFYAINNYIYYITKGGSYQSFDTLEPYYEILSNAEQNQNHWQNRFHDTLAWYNLRQAIRNRNNSELFNFYIKRADSRCQKFNPVLLREQRLKNRLEDLIEKEKLHFAE